MPKLIPVGAMRDNSGFLRGATHFASDPAVARWVVAFAGVL